MKAAVAVSAVVLAGLVAGCSEDGSRPNARDGVELRLVRDVSTVPEAGGEPVVYEPRELTSLGSDRAAVLDVGSPRIVVVDVRSGEAVARFGRQGGGPGEIAGGWAHLWEGPAGELMVADPENRRVMRYSASGELLAERSLATEWGIGAWMGVPGTDRLYVQENVLDEATAAMAHYLALVDPATGATRGLLRLPQPPPVPDGSFGMIRFFPRPLWTVLPDGRVVTGRTDSAVFTIHDSDGAPVGRLELPYSPRPVTELDRRRETEEWREATGSDREPGFYDLYPVAVRIMPVNDTVFAIQHMSNNYPAELEPPAEGRIVWTLISTAGRIVDTVAFPPEFVPRWSWNDRIVGIGRDELGVARLQEWRVEP